MQPDLIQKHISFAHQVDPLRVSQLVSIQVRRLKGVLDYIQNFIAALDSCGVRKPFHALQGRFDFFQSG